MKQRPFAVFESGTVVTLLTHSRLEVLRISPQAFYLKLAVTVIFFTVLIQCINIHAILHTLSCWPCVSANAHAVFVQILSTKLYLFLLWPWRDGGWIRCGSRSS